MADQITETVLPTRTRPIFISAPPDQAKNERIAQYRARRMKVEEGFKKQAPTIDKVELPDGGKAEVLSSLVDLEKPISGSNYRITIYVPGFGDAKIPNYGNHPLETKMAGAIFTDEVDAIMMIKAEGNNALAYVDKNANGVGQDKVAQADLKIFEKRLPQLKNVAGRHIEIRVVGYSEGSTQATKFALDLKEAGYDVKEYVSIGGAGLCGTVEQKNDSFLNLIKEASVGKELARTYHQKKILEKTTKNNPLLTKYFVDEGNGEFYVDKKIFGGLETSLEKAKVDLRDDVYNLGIMTTRLLKSVLGKVEGVPWERFSAFATQNDAYKGLAKNGVPIIIIAANNDPLLSGWNILNNARKIRSEYPGSKIIVVSSNIDHAANHLKPNGTAFILRTIEEKVGLGKNY